MYNIVFLQQAVGADVVGQLFDAARRLSHIVGINDQLRDAIRQSLFEPATADSDNARASAQATAPVVWLLGKTGAGKTAIIAALTGDARAEIGLGFEPCTRSAAFYDAPPEAPLLRFLDTRGLGEAGYDPAGDMSWCEGQSHLVLVVMQVSDPAQHVVLHALQQVRRRHPEWPVVVAQTGLHGLYPAGMTHPIRYPYTGGPEDETQPSLPHPLRQALAYQRKLFSGLRGPQPRFVPIDFTVMARLILRWPNTTPIGSWPHALRAPRTGLLSQQELPSWNDCCNIDFNQPPFAGEP